jgi:hypothetical protein
MRVLRKAAKEKRNLFVECGPIQSTHLPYPALIFLEILWWRRFNAPQPLGGGPPKHKLPLKDICGQVSSNTEMTFDISMYYYVCNDVCT